MHFKIVYYSHFWYSRFMNPEPNENFGNVLRQEYDRHNRRLRLLAVVFEKIYIPRTHLITQHHESQWKVPNQIFTGDDFRYLLDRDMFLISTLPGLDDKEDNERIIERSTLTKDVSYANLEKYLRNIPKTSRFDVASGKEAKGNLQTFADYGENLDRKGSNISEDFLEIIKKSHLGEIPFFHEAFIKQLANKFREVKLFKTLWRETNSIYLTSGAPDEGSITQYFCPEIESIAYRFEPHNIDRYLFHPDNIEQFLNEFLSPELTSWLLYGPIELTYEFLDQSSECGRHLRSFRMSYFELVKRVSESQRSKILTGTTDLGLASKLMIDALHGSIDSQFSAAAGVLTDASRVAQAAGADSTGVASSLISPAVKYGSNKIRKILRNRMNPEISRFMNTLEKSLDRSKKKNG